MTNWIEWNGGECPIKSDKTRVEYNLRSGHNHTSIGKMRRWSHLNSEYDIIAYRIIEDHEPKEPKMTREQITAQIEALQKQLDALPVVSRVVWCPPGMYYNTHEEFVEVINGVPHIHGIAMKEVTK